MTGVPFPADSGHKSAARYAKTVGNTGKQPVWFLGHKREKTLQNTIIGGVGMKYVYQLFNSDAREIVDLREYEAEIIKAIRTVFEKIPIHVNEKTIEIDLPSPLWPEAPKFIYELWGITIAFAKIFAPMYAAISKGS